MKKIRDKNKLEMCFEEQRLHFQYRPQVLELIQFEEGELLDDPLHPIESFYIIADGSVSIYHLTEEGDIRYISKAGAGILLGDIEFSGVEKNLYYAEAAETVTCLAIPFLENQSILENDPIFLKFVLKQMAKKLSLSSKMDVVTQTLEEKVLFYLNNIQPDHEILSVNQALQELHCSRRQLQRVLKKLCDNHVIAKNGRGCYRLL